jgi:chloramphenicol-sensitive protein RarD
MKKGVLSAGAAYAIWGFFPLYFKAIHAAPALQIVAHRVVWSFLFVAVLLLYRQEFRTLRQSITLRTILIYLVAAVLLAINWLVYVYSVNAGFVIEASLGYFINPLVSVLLGVVILREKLRTFQWLPIGLATAAVVFMTLSVGRLPWIALALAFSFGLYGLVKKIAPLNSLHGLTLETTLLFIPALIFLLYSEASGTGVFGHVDWFVSVLLALTGVVTAIPLLLFASGARLVPLSTIGMLQYGTPTFQFLIGVYVFGEPLLHSTVIGFIVIWIALILFTLENLYTMRKSHLANMAAKALSA